MKSLQVSIEEDLHRRLRRVAADRGETQANLIREAVEALVEQHEKKTSETAKEGR